MRIKELRENAGLQQKELALELGIPSNTLSQYENGKREPNIEMLKKLADYFKVSTDFISGNSDAVFCHNCGFYYNPLDSAQQNNHQKYHEAWTQAVIKYGFCWNFIKSDESELLAKKRLESESSSTELKLLSAEDILKAHFSNELRRHDFDYPYDFNHFAALELGTSVIRDMFPKEIYDSLVEKYGIEFEENVVQFTAKDERDIKKDLDSLMEKLSSKEYGPAAYDGEDIPEDDQELFAGQVELMLRRLKAINKEQYNPNKNKK